MEKILKILFVEDVQSDAELIWRAIEKSDIGFEKLLVDNKNDFLEALNTFDPDIIISDYSMPRFDGMSALLLRNEIKPLVPFILVTGSVNELVAVECMKTGADDYILKDNLSRLGLTIKNSIRKAKLEKEKIAAERELILSEQRLQKAQAIAHVGNWEIDFSKKTMWGSEEALRIYGLDTNCHEIPLKTAREIPLHEYKNILDETLDRLLKYNEPYQIEFKIKRVNDGEIRSIYSKAELSVNEEDKKIKVIGVIQDITEQKRAEEIILENEEIFRNFMEYSPIYIFFKDENIRATRLSRNFEKMLGRPINELLGKSMDELFPSDFAKSMVADDKRILMEGKEIVVEEELNGRSYVTIKFPISIEGKPRFLAGYTIDITDRKQSEDALKQSELRFKQISENSGEWIWEVDKNGMYTFSSSIVKNILGYEPEELVNKKHFYDLFEPESRDQMKQAAMETFAKKVVFTDFINHNIHKNGTVVILSTSGLPLIDGGGNLIGYRGVDTNITERKKAEEALAQSKKEFQNYFESGSVGMSVTLPDKRWIEVNQKLCQMFGYSKEELLGMTWMDLSHPDDLDKNSELFQMALKGNIDKYELEKRFVRKDGKVIYVTTSVVCERNPDGKVHHFLASYIDVTEKVLAEEALQESENKYRSIFENIQDLYYETTMDGTIIEVSPSITTLSHGQFRPEDVLGKSMSEFYSITEERNSLLEALKTRGSISDYEITLRNRDGSLIPCSVSSKIKFDPDGRPEKIIGSMRDISVRKRMEEELKKTQTQLLTAHRIAHLGSWEYDVLNDIFIFNDPFYEIFHTNAAQTDGYKMKSEEYAKRFIHPDDLSLVAEEISKAIETDDPFYSRQLEHRFIDDDGEVGYLSVQFFIVKDEQGRTIKSYGVNQDITERKKIEIELIKAKEKAEESDKLKTAFLHNISHEIRTPMNAIVGFSALLGESVLDKETQLSYIETIMQSSNHLLAIISDIVDISNIEANLVKIGRNEVNVNSTLLSLCRQLSAKAIQKKIELKFESELPDSEALIMTDNTKLVQIVTNLISNALKFTIEGFVKVNLKLVNDYLQISVSDSGIGIPEEYHEKVFERFFQVQNNIDRLYEGTGLGLAISKAFVELLGGKIWLTSKPGNGTIFNVIIPYEKQIVPKKSVTVKQGPDPFVFKRKLKILVAEDIDSNFKLVTFFFKGTNAEIIRASNGKIAVEKFLSEKNIDLILMDIKMPEMDGYTAVKLIRETNKTVPIIAQTAYADDRAKAMEIGCNGFLSKPFDKFKLLNTVKEYV